MPRPSVSERLRSRSDRRWHELAAVAAAAFEERLGATRYLRLSERDRARLARRLREVIDSGLEVPPGLPARAAATAAALCDASGTPDAPDVAWRRVTERARRAAAIGSVTTLPAMVPGLGTAMATLGLVADWRYVAHEQRDLVLELAALFGVPLAEPTVEVRSLFVAGAATVFGETPTDDDIVQVLADHVARRSVARVVPGAGAVVASALNFLSTVAIGRAAMARFARKAGLQAGDYAPGAAHPQMPQLEQAIVAAVKSALSGDDVPPPLFTVEQRSALQELTAFEHEALFNLAVVCSVSQGGVPAEEQRMLRLLAEELGFPVERLLAALSGAQHDVATFAVRFRRLLDSEGDSPTALTRLIWRRTRALARGLDARTGPEPADGLFP